MLQQVFRRAVGRLCTHLAIIGVDLPAVVRSFRRFPRLMREKRKLAAALKQAQDPLPFGRDFPCLHDRDVAGGSTATHYFHQDLHVARRIFVASPARHLDIGSRIDGFVAHVAAFRRIEVVDIRHLPEGLPNIAFHKADFMKPISAEMKASTDSLSCLHALEHFGLGRYGDPLDPDGHLKGLDNLHSILKPGGTLYLSVPIGPSRIEFNAHRVFAIPHVVRLLRPRFRIVRFSFVDDAGEFHEDRPFEGSESEASYGCLFGCGIFEAVRL